MRFAALLALSAAIGCDGPPPKPVGYGLDVPEPDAPLRPPKQRGTVPAESHVVDYAIEAKLDAEGHTVTGRERITWRNTSSAATSVLPFHLYMNGFRAEDTAWMREGRGSHRTAYQNADDPWGYCDVTGVKLVGGDALQWAEGEDPSVMTVTLPTPVEPGGQIEVDVEFTTLFPRVFARTGFYEDFYLAGQWFPKVGVLEPGGAWSNHVFTFHSEFYADFGDYRVELDVPKEMIVGATGIRTDEREEGERKIVTYEAAMVHDFAWTAWKDWVEHRSTHDGIRIRQLLPPDRFDDARFHQDAQVAALDSMQARFGVYPWSTITVVHTPDGADGAAGMEYPTFYTTGRRAARLPLVKSLGFDERGTGIFTTVHEFGHQYFQGLFASNENAQPWLDEGMNTYSNVMTLYDWWGEDPWIFKIAGHNLYATDLMRLDTARGKGVLVVDRSADDFARLEGLYSLSVYRKTAALMVTLRNLVGHERFDEALRTYGERYRFRHPVGSDLERTLVEVIGARVELGAPDEALPGSGIVELDVAAYLDQGLRTPKDVDFDLRDIDNLPAIGDAGYHRNEAGQLVGGGAPDLTPVRDRDSSTVDGHVVIGRPGGFAVPVEVEAEFDDGTTQRVWWDGARTSTVLKFPGRRVVRAGIDPDNLLTIETKRINNHRYAERPESEDGPPADLDEVGQALMLTILGGLGP